MKTNEIFKIGITKETELNKVLRPAPSKLKNIIVYTHYDTEKQILEIKSIRFKDKQKDKILFNKTSKLFIEEIIKTNPAKGFAYMYSSKLKQPTILKTDNWKDEQIINLIYSHINEKTA